MENRAVTSGIKITNAARANRFMGWVSVSDKSAAITAQVMMKARMLEGELPEKITKAARGIKVKAPAHLRAAPVIKGRRAHRNARKTN